MVIGHLNRLHADVFYFRCCTHATNGIENVYTKVIPTFDARLVWRRNIFAPKLSQVNGQPTKKNGWGWGTQRDKKKQKGEKAKKEVQYFFKKKNKY